MKDGLNPIRQRTWGWNKAMRAATRAKLLRPCWRVKSDRPAYYLDLIWMGSFTKSLPHTATTMATRIHKVAA
jgi:hypothetical protein